MQLLVTIRCAVSKGMEAEGGTVTWVDKCSGGWTQVGSFSSAAAPQEGVTFVNLRGAMAGSGVLWV